MRTLSHLDGNGATGRRDIHVNPFRLLTGNANAGGYDDGVDIADLVMQADLILRYKHASLADVYAASATFMPPSLIRLADRKNHSLYSNLRAMVAAEQVRIPGLIRLLRNELLFQKAVVEALGCETLILLMDMLHEIIEHAASRMDPCFHPVVRSLAEVTSHKEIVRLIEAGDGKSAAALVGARTMQIECLLREYDTKGDALALFTDG
jgi:DNA-binding FadR family transcriptional regulator